MRRPETARAAATVRYVALLLVALMLHLLFPAAAERIAEATAAYQTTPLSASLAVKDKAGLLLFSTTNLAALDSEEGSKRPITFVDLLSSDERFSEFLHTVQRLRMVIQLNRIRNGTLFVPTNEALREYRKEYVQKSSIAGSVYRSVSDQQAWYHFIADGAIDAKQLASKTMLWESYSRSAADVKPGDNNTAEAGIMLKTQTNRRTGKLEANGIPVIARSFSCEAGNAFLIDGVLDIPPSIRELLRQEAPGGQLSSSRNSLKQQTQQERSHLRQLNQLSATASERTHGEAIGLSFEEGDVEDMNEYGLVERLLVAAGWLDAIVSSEAGEMHTLWAFNNKAFSGCFSFAERSYLLNGPEFAADDQALLEEAIKDARIVAERYVSSGAISLARLGDGEHEVSGFRNRTGHTLIVSSDPRHGGWSGQIDGQPISNADIVAENGIVHGIEEVHRPENLVFTPQKILVGLNATLFIRLLKDTGLGEYIDGSRQSRELTILAPTNRAMEDAFGYDLGDDRDGSDGPIIAANLAKVLSTYDVQGEPLFAEPVHALPLKVSPRERQRDWALYHLVDGQQSVDDLAKNPLLRTLFSPDSTNGKQQVVKAHVDQAHGALSKHVSFNGADNILSEPVVVGNTTIYLLSSPMPTPPSLVNALIPNLELSLFVAAMGASNIVDQIQQEAGVTVLAPVTNAFTSLGLVWSYLSLPGDSGARSDLSRLVKAHILKKPVYSDEIPLHTGSTADTLVVETLNGNKVGLYRTQHGIFAVVDQKELPPSFNGKGLRQHTTGHLTSVSSDTSNLHISESDILLRTGVAHVLENGLILPSNVEITSTKLLHGMKAHIFADLLERFNLTHVLEDPHANKTLTHRQQRTGGVARTAHSSDSTEDGDTPDENIVGYSLLVPSDKAWRENAAYRELVRRDHDEVRIIDDGSDSSNPWRNATTADIKRYLDMLVRLHIIPVVGDRTQAYADGHQLPANQLRLADRKTYPTLLENVKLKAHEFASDRFSIQLADMPFYQAPGGAPFISFAMVVRSGIARTGAVFELDSALRLPPDDNSGPGGWKQFAWNAAVWLTGIGMGSGLLGVSGYWVRQWWTRSDYESL
ncbi:hypothetical protein BX070DRAFT_237043 [Coemansia spiralis]|nr:hypothetical protein BX070DRAFT_237043 [Coemansia spiralis]